MIFTRYTKSLSLQPGKVKDEKFENLPFLEDDPSFSYAEDDDEPEFQAPLPPKRENRGRKRKQAPSEFNTEVQSEYMRYQEELIRATEESAREEKERQAKKQQKSKRLREDSASEPEASPPTSPQKSIEAQQEEIEQPEPEQEEETTEQDTSEQLNDSNEDLPPPAVEPQDVDLMTPQHNADGVLMTPAAQPVSERRRDSKISSHHSSPPRSYVEEEGAVPQSPPHPYNTQQSPIHPFPVSGLPTHRRDSPVNYPPDTPGREPVATFATPIHEPSTISLPRASINQSEYTDQWVSAAATETATGTAIPPPQTPMHNDDWDDDNNYLEDDGDGEGEVEGDEMMGEDETIESFEDRVLNKRAAQLHRNLGRKFDAEQGAPLGLLGLMRRSDKKQAATKFYSCLVLSKVDAVIIEQTELFGELTLHRSDNFQNAATAL